MATSHSPSAAPPCGSDCSNRAELDIGAGRIAAYDPAADTVGIAHEPGDKRVARLLVELARRALLRDDRLVHHDDPVRDGHRLRLIVRHIDDRKVEALLEIADLLAHLAAQTRVQVRQRLVEKQYRRLQHQRPGDGDTLLLTSGGSEADASRPVRPPSQAPRAPVRRLPPWVFPNDEAVADISGHCAGTVRSSGTIETTLGGGARSHPRHDPDGSRGRSSNPSIRRIVITQPEGPSGVTSVPANGERDG
jgi:hypothetical protein